MKRRASIAVVWGVLMGGLTFAAGPLAVLSEHTVVATVQTILTYLLIPGLIVAAAVGSLIPAAGINALIHFALCFFVLRFVPGLKSVSMRD
jgi:hypothetical protein